MVSSSLAFVFSNRFPVRTSPAFYRRRLGWLLGLAALLLALAFRLDYSLPGFDRHPSCDKFPRLSNPRLVVEEIPDFAVRYGARYHLPAAAVEEARPVNAFWFEDYYRTNLKSVRTLGYRRTGNAFSWGRGNETGRTHLELPHFRPAGYEYLELSLAGMKKYFKE